MAQHESSPPAHDPPPRRAHTGRCLCGAVAYEVRGPLRDVLICHCEECRRWHGHVSASTAAAKEDLVLVEQRGLRWIDSPRSDAGARRGFCAECGSSLFWDPPRRATISIAAGTLDTAAGLRVVSHWYVSQAGEYYELPDDGLPHHERSGEGELP
ncbi:MAG TPA: GFA family protein [Solirubrobacteraceae bacterium]|nr:GFA family protein [Solirubrobacteraceae bacterium]